MSHFVCIASAVQTFKPTEARLYFEFEPQGFWWHQTRQLIDCEQIAAPREIFGRPLNHPAHRADITRLERLIDKGGVYLDTDVFVHKTFDHLRGHSVVLGREGDVRHAKLCNAVILAEPQAKFLLRWYDEYRDFRGSGGPKHWNEHSVLRPAALAERFPEEVTILSNRAFFWPLFDDAGLRAIFEQESPIVAEETLATHLWENKAWHRYLQFLTPADVRERSGNFYRWAAPYLENAPAHVGSPTLAEKLKGHAHHFQKSARELNYRVSNKIAALGGKR